jgi:sulfur relay (sulfurtransferase) complex TusBCD TusD component (DsrE family)
MRREDRREFLKILQAHEQTIEICAACATTTRELATEVARGGLPSKADLVRTAEEADRVLTELAEVRREVERLIGVLS